MRPIRCFLLCASFIGLMILAAPGQAGREGVVEAYYNGQLFTTKFYELPEEAAARIIERSRNIDVMYVTADPLPGGEEFVPVIDAIHGEGFNAHWIEVAIEFNAGFTPRQLFSNEEILNAVDAGEIRLVSTGDVYRGSVVGPREKDSGDGPAVERDLLRTLSQPPPVSHVTWSAIKSGHSR